MSSSNNNNNNNKNTNSKGSNSGSVVGKEAMEVIAQSIGISNLSPDVALALAPDVEYRVREIMQEAIKCMRHSKRTTLTAADVDAALNLRNVDPIYGFASGDPLPFKRATGHKDLFYFDNKDVDLKDVIDTPLPETPLDTAVVVHWLAIEGVQPAVPANSSLECLAMPSDTKKSEYKEDGVPVDIKLPVKNIISRELQLYYDKITELTMSRSHSPLFKEALLSLSTDSGLQPLVPKFICFIADQIQRKMSDFSHLFALMRVVMSLLQNQQIYIDPYLHQVMPSVLTCLVTRRLGNRLSDNEWELRNFSANLVASICKRFGHVYHYFQSRVARTMINVFLDPAKALPQHYGAIQGLASLGPRVVRYCILPNLELYLQLLEPDMLFEMQKNEVKRHEAWRVYGALMNASALCLYDQLKMSPSILTPPALSFKNHGRIETAIPSKRKASMDNLMQQQPPLKKVAMDGPTGVIAMNSLRVGMQGAADRFSTAIVGSELGTPLVSRQLTNESISGSSNRRENATDGASKRSIILAGAWKEDTDTGNLMASLFECFGERILSLAPTHELSYFI